ncbi:unnamed protein product [Penicillium camemberti]|uniref:Str. FM013 n=1 Tax=Penicillium camemberti (strain FM 013) TaxID=1429867 RepID=A0A0G4PYN0_PENC3|nr:unnamed protein product [Penicillium camemberti]
MELSIRPIAHPQSRDPYRFFPLDGKDLNSVTDKALATLLISSPILY